jgi:dCMP deaminase
VETKFVDYFMRVAEETAALSYATRLQVGCVIVKDRRILSIGYNGTPAGWDNCCEDKVENYDPATGTTWHSTVTKDSVLHAESNALMKLCQSHESSKDAAVFITHAPCINCAKLLHQAGISEVIYKTQYRSKDGIEFLNQCGVKTWQKKGIG